MLNLNLLELFNSVIVELVVQVIVEGSIIVAVVVKAEVGVGEGVVAREVLVH